MPEILRMPIYKLMVLRQVCVYMLLVSLVSLRPNEGMTNKSLQITQLINHSLFTNLIALVRTYLSRWFPTHMLQPSSLSPRTRLPADTIGVETRPFPVDTIYSPFFFTFRFDEINSYTYTGQYHETSLSVKTQFQTFLFISAIGRRYFSALL